MFLYGYYGRRNAGDDAMLYAFLKTAVSINPLLEFRVLRGEDTPEVPESAKSSITFVPSNVPAVLKNLLGADVFAIVGGTHLTDYGLSRRTLLMIGRIALLVSFSKLLGKKIYYLGAGLGPFRRFIPTAIARLACEQADVITVRDQTSFEVTTRLGVAEKTTLGFDVAALADWRLETKPDTATSTHRTLGVSITPVFRLYHDDEKSDRVLAESIGEAINAWMLMHPDWRVSLFVFHGKSSWTKDDDLHITSQLQAILRPKERVELVPYQSNPLEVFRGVSRCSAFAAMKYHACLFAYLSDIPLLVIPYHPKCAALAREIRLPAEAQVPITDVLNGRLGKYLEILTSPERSMKATLPVETSESRARTAIEVLAEVDD